MGMTELSWTIHYGWIFYKNIVTGMSSEFHLKNVSSCGIWISVFQKTLTWVVVDGLDESYHGSVMQNVWQIRWIVVLVSNFLLLGVETIRLHFSIVKSTEFGVIHRMHCFVSEWEWSSCSTGVVASVEFGFDPFYLDVLCN